MAIRHGGGTLYIAGSSYAIPRPGRANSGYLLQAGGLSIAIDFGSGAFSNLREKIDPVRLDALIVSHMHADHFFDLVPLRYALCYELEREKPLPVYLPPGGIGVVNHIGDPLKENENFYDGAFELHEYAPDATLQIGGCTVHFKPGVHYIPSYAMRFETPGGVLAYSADTAPCEAVAALAKDADIFLCECSLGSKGSENGMRGHLNAREAGELAQTAGAKHLILTHYGVKAIPAAMRSAAADAFRGQISVADDRMEFVF
jgi:ribonuclease BN (tRNA processing enzyme)